MIAPSLLQNTTFSPWRARLTVRPHLRPRAPRLGGNFALLLDRRGWSEDEPFLVHDIDLDTAQAVAWAGEA